MNDLSLISIDELIDEVEKRCNSFVCAYTPVDFNIKKESRFRYGKGKWFESCALANILNNDILNNWNGELKKLQRLNEEVE
jgi:hypothetical protein